MGVKNLWKLFPPSDYEDPKNKKIGVDISSWLYQLNNTNLLYNTFYRLIKLINNSNKPFFVFDGQPSFLKKLTLQKRKERKKESEFNNFISNIVNNRMCKCKKLFRVCEHGSGKNDQFFQSLFKNVKSTLKHHNYNWGDEYSFPTNLNTAELTNLSIPIFNTKNYSFLTQNLEDKLRKKKSKKDKLNYLSKLREQRSAYNYQNDTLESFSFNQIENVKKRNKVLEMINQIERNRVMSDCKKIFYVKKEIVSEDSEEESELVFTEEESDKNEIKEESDLFQDEIEKEYEEKSDTNEKDIKIGKEQESEESTNKIFKVKKEEHSEIKKEEYLEEIKKEEYLKEKEELEEINELKENTTKLIEEDSYNDLKKESLNDHTLISNPSKKIEAQKNKTVVLNEINLLYVSALDTIKQVIFAFNLPIIQSIGESDAQLAYMNQSDLLDCIISDDNDIFVYNGRKIYRNFFTSTPTMHTNDRFNNQAYLIKLAYLLECDYSVGIKNVGLKKALKLVDSVTDEDIKYLSEIYCNSPVINVNEPEFSVSKSKVLDSFRRMGGSKEDSLKLERLLEKCDCNFLSD